LIKTFDLGVDATKRNLTGDQEVNPTPKSQRPKIFYTMIQTHDCSAHSYAPKTNFHAHTVRCIQEWCRHQPGLGEEPPLTVTACDKHGELVSSCLVKLHGQRVDSIIQRTYTGYKAGLNVLLWQTQCFWHASISQESYVGRACKRPQTSVNLPAWVSMLSYS